MCTVRVWMWSVASCYMPETRILLSVCQAVSQPWDRAVHGGGRPAFRERAAGRGRNSAHMYTSLDFTVCPHGRRRGGTVVSFPCISLLTCASQLMMVQFLQDELVSGPKSVPLIIVPSRSCDQAWAWADRLPNFYPPSILSLPLWLPAMHPAGR